MVITLQELFSKDVIDISDGGKVGEVSDAEFNTENGKLIALLITPESGFGLKKTPVYRAKWEDITVMGKQTVLVRHTEQKPRENTKSKSFLKFFSK